MSVFEWCLNQKDGLKKIKANKFLCEELMDKARNDLLASDLMQKNNQLEWFIIINYYAMYHSSLALLALIGYESRNHTCTRIALEEIFIKHNKKSIQHIEWLNESYSLKKNMINALSQAKQLREEVQYNIKDIMPQLAQSEHEKAIQFIKTINSLINEIKKELN